MAAYFLLETAQRDLEGIWRYYDRFGGEDLADQRIVDLHHSFQLIAEFPHIGRPRPEFDEGIRSFVSYSPAYTIFYFPLEGVIEIAHVLHGSEDVSGRFDLSD